VEQGRPGQAVPFGRDAAPRPLRGHRSLSMPQQESAPRWRGETVRTSGRRLRARSDKSLKKLSETSIDSVDSKSRAANFLQFELSCHGYFYRSHILKTGCSRATRSRFCSTKWPSNASKAVASDEECEICARKHAGQNHHPRTQRIVPQSPL
jgi:hypothetical protein